VLASGDILTGATVHLVNEEYDSGEILSQIEVPVLPDDSVTTLEARVKETEKTHLVAVLNELWTNKN
jgi:phosphoribosylglycinamide formyltransferase-1